MTERPQERLGVDIGRVIIDSPTDGSGPSIFDQDRYLQAPLVKGAVSTLRRLGERRFGPNIDLVSKCGPKIQDRSRERLEYAGFHSASAIGPDRMHFCLTREEKGIIAARLGLTHFIDDSLEVFTYLPDEVTTRILFDPDEDEIRRVPGWEQHMESVQIAEDWEQVQGILLPKH